MEAACIIQHWWRGVLASRESSIASVRKSDPDDGVVDDEQLHRVWFPIDEWRLATNHPLLATECIQSVWMGDTRGMRDYDIGIWFLIEGSHRIQYKGRPM